MEGFIFLVAAVVVLVFIIKNGEGDDGNAAMSAKADMEKQMICPYCQTKGSVTTRKIKQKVGVSGGKATAALLTCGISLLGTGLSRKQEMTQANCNHCGSVYTF